MIADELSSKIVIAAFRRRAVKMASKEEGLLDPRFKAGTRAPGRVRRGRFKAQAGQARCKSRYWRDRAQSMFSLSKRFRRVSICIAG
jgi:hypothetical protein